MEGHSFRIVSGDLPETMRKQHLSTKLKQQEIRWNYGILRSEWGLVWIHISAKSEKVSKDIYLSAHLRKDIAKIFMKPSKNPI